MKKMQIKGFTLIELLVVIAIVGVLTAIIVPSVVSYTSNAKLSTANSNAKLAYTNTNTYSLKCSMAGYSMNEDSSIDTPQPIQRLDSDPVAVPDVTGVPTGQDLLQVIRILMGTKSDDSGYVEVKIRDTGNPGAASWTRKLSDGYVGNYPNLSTSRGEQWCMTN